jgi:hypothetical protein
MERSTMTYDSEFPREYHPTAGEVKQLQAAGLADDSWHNNICCSWRCDKTERVLFVDCIDPAERECTGADRFSVSTDDCETIHRGNNLAAAIAATIEIDRFSPQGEAIAAVNDAAWQAIGDKLRFEFPDASYGDLSPGATAGLDAAIKIVVIEWIDNNVPTDARCDNCHCSASADDRGTTCRNCGRGVIR